MARKETLRTDPQGRRVEVYSSMARFFHWLTVLLIAVQVPIGLYMVYRGNEMVWTNDKGETKTGLWDATTNTLYSSHKLIGVIILGFVVLRLLYRFGAGAPKPEPTLNMAQKVGSEVNHWGIYLMLLVVPVLGYIGISYYGALNVFGIPFPALTGKDEGVAEKVFEAHGLAAWALLALVALHVGAALYHYFVRRDYVLARMMPGLVEKTNRRA